MRNALARGELELHYQPQISLGTGQIVAVEALLRWRHAERGVLCPAEFMEVAEASGLIVPIGHWVIESACRQLGAWQRLGKPILLSINLSRQQFRDPELERVTRDALEASGVSAASLNFDVSEEVIMTEFGKCEERLRRLAEAGIGLSIDDFGTGQSALHWLHCPPIRRIKVNQTCMHEPDPGLPSHPLVQAIIALSHDLGIMVTAEGVETEEQRSRLSGYGCDEVQGYLTGPPLPAPEIESLILH